MNIVATNRKIKEVYNGQVEKIVSIIEKFRGDRALTYRPLVRILGTDYTLCLERTEENDIKVMFTDVNDNFLLDSYDLNMSSVFVIFSNYDHKKIFDGIQELTSQIVLEFICR